MPAIDEELWANLYRLSYSAPNRTTSLAANYHTHPASWAPGRGDEPGPEQGPPVTRGQSATCCSGGTAEGMGYLLDLSVDCGWGRRTPPAAYHSSCIPAAPSLHGALPALGCQERGCHPGPRHQDAQPKLQLPALGQGS